MNEDIAQELLHELFASLEALETQSAAILSFLKAKGIATDEDLAPHLEQAGNAANVRWLATRVRMDHLLSAAIKAEKQDAKAQSDKTEPAKTQPAPKPENAQQPQANEPAEPSAKQSDKNTQNKASAPERESEARQPEANDVRAAAERHRNAGDETKNQSPVEVQDADKNQNLQPQDAPKNPPPAEKAA